VRIGNAVDRSAAQRTRPKTKQKVCWRAGPWKRCFVAQAPFTPRDPRRLLAAPAASWKLHDGRLSTFIAPYRRNTVSCTRAAGNYQRRTDELPSVQQSRRCSLQSKDEFRKKDASLFEIERRAHCRTCCMKTTTASANHDGRIVGASAFAQTAGRRAPLAGTKRHRRGAAAVVVMSLERPRKRNINRLDDS